MSDVKLYVYEVTRGMAQQLSPMLIGRQIDGVWHTGIVVYGYEFFYGGDGINFCPPAGTILGPPNQVVELGSTEIPADVFQEYLAELGNSRFKGNDYHLLDHNCNTFSNEIAQFLTGNTIPSFITSLPSEVMSTPFGQMIRPFIDSMMTGLSQGAPQQWQSPGVNTAQSSTTTTVQRNITNSTDTSSNRVTETRTETEIISRTTNPATATSSQIHQTDAQAGSDSAGQSQIPSQPKTGKSLPDVSHDLDLD